MPTPVMRIGDLNVEALSDGLLKTSIDLVLRMERAQAAELVGTEDGSVVSPVNNFVLRRGGNVIMIDAGAGNTMQPTLGRLPAASRGSGIDPKAVTHIVLTHL